MGKDHDGLEVLFCYVMGCDEAFELLLGPWLCSSGFCQTGFCVPGAGRARCLCCWAFCWATVLKRYQVIEMVWLGIALGSGGSWREGGGLDCVACQGFC